MSGREKREFQDKFKFSNRKSPAVSGESNLSVSAGQESFNKINSEGEDTESSTVAGSDGGSFVDEHMKEFESLYSLRNLCHEPPTFSELKTRIRGLRHSVCVFEEDYDADSDNSSDVISNEKQMGDNEAKDDKKIESKGTDARKEQRHFRKRNSSKYPKSPRVGKCDTTDEESREPGAVSVSRPVKRPHRKLKRGAQSSNNSVKSNKQLTEGGLAKPEDLKMNAKPSTSKEDDNFLEDAKVEQQSKKVKVEIDDAQSK